MRAFDARLPMTDERIDNNVILPKHYHFLLLYCGCDENRSLPPAITRVSNSGFHTEQSISEMSQLRLTAHHNEDICSLPLTNFVAKIQPQASQIQAEARSRKYADQLRALGLLEE